MKIASELNLCGARIWLGAKDAPWLPAFKHTKFHFRKKKISIKSQEIFTNDEFWKLYQINKWKYFGDEDRVDSSRFVCRNWTNFRTENLLKNLHLLNFCWYRTKLFFVSSRKMPCKNWKLQKLEGDFLESNTYLNFSCMGVLKNSVNFSMET